MMLYSARCTHQLILEVSRGGSRTAAGGGRSVSSRGGDLDRLGVLLRERNGIVHSHEDVLSADLVGETHQIQRLHDQMVGVDQHELDAQLGEVLDQLTQHVARGGVDTGDGRQIDKQVSERPFLFRALTSLEAVVNAVVDGGWGLEVGEGRGVRNVLEGIT